MLYKKTLLILIFFILSNCTTANLVDKQFINEPESNFTNKGFALIYDESLYLDKVISKKIEERSLIIFQKNLKKNTQVKITNILNNKSLIAIVGKNSNYPAFNNSVISSRIAKELMLNINEPYVEISSINKNSLFVAKKAKTYDEEKKVANKVPVTNISINDLNKPMKENNSIVNRKFLYVIKIGDFYFKKTALIMINRIKVETNIKKPKLEKMSDKKYRVYLGPFDNINSLQKSFNDINILEFENIEIIKND